MAKQGFQMEIDVRDFAKVKALLDEKQEKLKTLDTPLRTVAVYMHRSIMLNFIEQGRPDKWLPIKPETVDARRHRKKDPSDSVQILMDSGTLRQDINIEWNDAEVRIGSATPYAAVHQFGFKPRNISARPFIMIQDADKDVIEKILTEYLGGVQ